MNFELSLPHDLQPAFAEVVAANMLASGMALRAPEREEPYTVEDCAKAVGLSERTIRTEISAGAWPLVARTGRKLVPVWAVRVRQAGGDPLEELNRRKKEGFLK